MNWKFFEKKMIVVLVSAILLVTGCSAASLENAGKEIQDTIDDLEDSNNKYVKMVKGGYREDNPDLTYDQAFSSFFGTPRWNYFEGEDGQDVVEFTGDCTYQDVAVKARIQFVVDEENGTFEATYLAFNEVPQNMLVLAALMEKVFEETETMPQEIQDFDDNSMQFETDIQDVALPAGAYAWMDGDGEDAHGADIVISYESDGKARLTGECWNSVATASIDASAVSANTDGSVQFVGNVILSEFDEETQIRDLVLDVFSTQQNEIQIEQNGETGSVTFAGIYQAAGGESFDIYDIYGDVIYEVALTYGSDCEYALYDMDHDGTVELITSQGTSDADWSNTVYTIDDSGMLVEVGTFYGLVALYASENGDGIYSVYGHMDYQEVEWITKNGNDLYTETILSGETVEYYENDNPIPMVGIDEDIMNY